MRTEYTARVNVSKLKPRDRRTSCYGRHSERVVHLAKYFAQVRANDYVNCFVFFLENMFADCRKLTESCVLDRVGKRIIERGVFYGTTVKRTLYKDDTIRSNTVQT